MSSFTDRLLVEPNDDGTTWTLCEPFRYWLDELHKGDVLTIPAGFITDFASVPQVFWNILPPTGKYGKAAVVHDYLYQYLGHAPVSQTCESPARWRTFSRAECDQILLDAMKVLGVSAWVQYVIYYAVRAGGWVIWNEHEHEKKYPPIFKP